MGESIGAVFDRIYSERLWGGAESHSGPGSGAAATHYTALTVRLVVHGLGAESVVDVACGDGFWQPELPGYVGLDVAPKAIARARALHPDRDYRLQDASLGVPQADVVLCRDAMQHLAQAEGLALLQAIRESGSNWLLASTYTDGHNELIATGEAYRPNLEAPPFGLEPALLLLRDGWDYETGMHQRDPGKYLGLWLL